MRPARNFVVRIVVYSIALLYLAGDLFLFNGPLNRRIQAGRPDSPQSLAEARSHGVVARVFGHPILLSQVERATRARLWSEGKSIDGLTPDQRRIARLAALNDLIDHQILRVKTLHNGDGLPVSDEEINAALEELAARYPDREAMTADLAAEGIDSDEELRLRLGAGIQRRKYVESRIAGGIEVGEEEAREWFERHADEFALPSRVRARHIFLSTAERDPAEARESLGKALEELKADRAEFPKLAAELSEDTATKDSGGELGWMGEARLPVDFGKPLFEMPVGEPMLLRTTIGWHLVEVMERKPAERRGFEDARSEVIAAIEASKRQQMVGNLRQALRNREEIGVHVFSEMITGE